MASINFKSVAEVELEIKRGIETSFIHNESPSNYNVRPRFIFNNKEIGQTVLSVINNELRQCREFWFSVAFITMDGIEALKLALAEAAERGVKGRILTSRYLDFNSPKALRELLKLKNVEAYIYEEQLHTKGYCFKNDYFINLLIGSSNLTTRALKTNKEWNLRISSLDKGEVVRNAESEFEEMCSLAKPLTDEWIDAYEEFYIPKQRVLQEASLIPLAGAKLSPNRMQQEALAAFKELRETGAKKALLISATGTGKTYLSAFDVRTVRPKRLLFLAHREQLLQQAMKSFEVVLGNSVSMGIVSGTTKNINCDFLFATIQSISNDDMLAEFAKDAFDYIIVDEVHRAGAYSYQKVLDYFTPAFLMGMTATPERGDGKDIYALFDHNIAYEIRLQQALEADLLCPFYYYGISDIKLIGDDRPAENSTEKKEQEAIKFSLLTSNERIRHIVEKINYYGYSGDTVKGLVFCSTINEAKNLAEKFCELGTGYRAVALSGNDSQAARAEAIRRLEMTDGEEALEYIFTVDIFNEGVDIPAINQVIMLRSTQSAIVFVQQLGRGLRKYKSSQKNKKGIYDEKDFLVVIDFIGNYNNNFLIPIALSGDTSFNKDNLRRHVAEGDRSTPGLSTINFDRIAKEKIYKAIDRTQLNSIRILKEAYSEVKLKLGRIPHIIDFERLGSIDMLNFFSNTSVNSYYGFLRKYEKDFTTQFTVEQENMMAFVCKKLANGKRAQELQILNRLLDGEECILEGEEILLNSVEKVLTNQYIISEAVYNTYKDAVFVERSGDVFSKTSGFTKAISDTVFKQMFREVVEFGLRKFGKVYSKSYKDTDLTLNEKYTYEDVCRLLRWDKNILAQNIGGYKYDELTKTFPVFINYHKAEEIAETIKYEDQFLSVENLTAYSKSNRTMKSNDIVRLKRSESNQMKIYLFVRRDKNDKNQSKEFYFLGSMKPIGYKQESMAGNSSVVKINYQLEEPVRDDLYSYITTESI